MSGEFGSYNSGYFHAQIEYAAADLENGEFEITRLWAKFFKAFGPVAYAIAWAEAGDCGPEVGILATIARMPAMRQSLKEIDDAMQVYWNVMEAASKKGDGEMINLPSIHDAPCPQLETKEMLNSGRLTLATLSADPQSNTLGQHLRQQWDAARAAGQSHGVWRPEMGRFITMKELEQQP